MLGLWIWLNILHVWQAFEDLKQETIISSFYTSSNIRISKAIKLFFLIRMMSELSKYLNDQLVVFLNVKHEKWSQLKTKKKWIFKRKLFRMIKYFIKYLCYISSWKLITFPLKHVTLYQKKQERSKIAVFEPIGAVIFTHRHSCIKTPFSQVGRAVILWSGQYLNFRGAFLDVHYRFC